MRKPGQRLDEDIREAIETLARDGYLPSEIERRLGGDERFAERVPSDKTIQKYRRATLNRLAAASAAPWRPTDSAPDEAVLVLPVLAEVIERTPRRELTVDEAEWIVRIRVVAPDLPLWEVYQLASTARDTKGAARVTRYLAFAPWTADGERRLRAATGPARALSDVLGLGLHTWSALQKARKQE
jgi:hypothetical protein